MGKRKLKKQRDAHARKQIKHERQTDFARSSLQRTAGRRGIGFIRRQRAR